MRYFKNSRPLQISLGLSTLLHLCFFLYLYSLPPFKKTENTPIAVEFISPPKEEQKTGRSYMAIKKEYTMPRAAMPEPYAAPTPSMPQESPSPGITEEARISPVPHFLEVPKALTPPNLTPSPERLAKIEEEKREGEADEETISLDSTDFKYTSYLNGVKSRIEEIWRYPEAAKKSALQGRGLVSFTIQRDGSLSELKLITSSGYPVLDEEILKAIKAAAPFNPMADNMSIKRLNVVATFEYNLIIQRIWGN